jgi:MYXO-CTERM domain-containing protein
MKNIRMRRVRRSLLALALALTGAATMAQAQSLQLACAANAAAGDAATPITLTTGSGWDMRYGAAGTWGPAYTGFRHAAWYNPPTGTWLTPGDPAALLPSVDPYFYRSPVIQVDGARIDLASITATVQEAADNYYNATGIVNSGTPAAGTLVTSSAAGFAALGAPFTPALPWAAGANQLLLQVTNAEPVHTAGAPTGVYATITLTATCLAAPVASPTAVPVDSPWALMLAGLGLAGLARRRLRRR